MGKRGCHGNQDDLYMQNIKFNTYIDVAEKADKICLYQLKRIIKRKRKQ